METRLNPDEISVLRGLAQRYLEAAHAPRQLEVQRLWAALNTGRMQRPMVVFDQLPWHELADETLACRVADPYWRGVEQELRRTLYAVRHFAADKPLPPWILLPRVLKDPDFRAFGIKVREQTARTDEKSEVLSHEYIDQLSTPGDLEKIRPTRLEPDTEAEARLAAQADAVFGPDLPWRWQGVCLHLGLWDTISTWMSVENCYLRLLDEPEFLHAVLRRCCSVAAGWIEQGSRYGLFDTAGGVCHCSCTLTAPYAEPLPGTAANAWTFGLAQLFSSVSPAVTREFEVAYMHDLFDRFGSVYYGCCERLDDRVALVASQPNVRKVSCSPWSDPDRFAAALPKHVILSNKPNPALLAADTLDEEELGRQLARVLAAARREGVGVELIFKDISTVRRQPERLEKAARLALRLAESW